MSSVQSENIEKFRKDSHRKTSEGSEFGAFRRGNVRRDVESSVESPESSAEQSERSRRDSRRRRKNKKKGRKKEKEPKEENKDSSSEEADTSRIDAINATDRSILETDNNLVDDDSSQSASDSGETDSDEWDVSDRDRVDSEEGKSDHIPEYQKEEVVGEDIDRMDAGHFITTEAKKSRKVELDKLTNNLLAFSNALQNMFINDAITIIEEEAKSFNRESFNEAVLFLFLTVYHGEKSCFKKVKKMMEELFEHDPEMINILDEEFTYKTLSNTYTDKRKEFNKFCLLKASLLSCSFLINLIIEDVDLTDLCITEMILSSVVENNMYEAINRILTREVNVSQGIVKKRKKYRNSYDPETEYDYVEKPEGRDRDTTFYVSENQNLRLLGANYVKSNLENDSKTKLKIKPIDVIIEMVLQNKKSKEIIGIVDRAKDKDACDSIFICFALHRKFMLINYLFTRSKNFLFLYPLFISCLENNCYDIAVLLYKDYESYLCESEVRENIVPHILNSFSKGTELIDAKCFLIKKFIRYFKLFHCKRLLDVYEYKLLTLARAHALVNNVNPVKTSCLLIEIIDLVDFYSLKIQKQNIKKQLIDNLLKVVNKVDSIAEMRHLFMDQDLELRDSLTFIWDNQIEDVLKNQFICQIVDELWNSSYNVDGFLWNASTSHQMLFNYDHCRYDYEHKHRFYQPVKLKDIHSHCFVFEVWKNSGRSRYYIDTAMVVVFAIILHWMIQTILDLDYKLEELEKNGGVPSTYDLDRLWDFNLALAGISFAYMLFPIQIVINAIYSTVNDTVMRLKSAGYIIDGFLFIFFLAFVFVTYAYNRDGTWAYQNRASKELSDQEIFYNNFKNDSRREDVLLIMIGVLFWIKVFYSFRLLPLIGPLQAILKVMVRPIKNYLIFFAINLLIFACIAHLLFQSLSNYADFYNCLKTLFPAAIGSFDLNDIDDSEIGSEGGKIFLGIFLVVNNMIIIATFIGLIVVVYRNKEKYSTIFYSYTTLALRPVSLANPKNSCLISAPVPLNGLHFLHMPVLLSLEEENAIIMNEVILHIIYIPILIIQVILFVIWSAALAPFVYVKIFLHKMAISFTYSRIYRDERNNKFLYGVAWIIIGPLILVANLIRDTVVFIIHCYNKDIDTTSHDIKTDFYISNSLLEKVAKVMNEYLKEGNRVVLLDIACDDICKEIKCYDAFYVKIFGQPRDGKYPEGFTERKNEEIIKSFLVIKNMLNNNSSKIDNFDEIVRAQVNTSQVDIKSNVVDVIDCKAILSFINSILTMRILHKVVISGQKNLFTTELEKRKTLLKELETLYGTYKIDKELISDSVIKRLELYMTRSIAYCNTRRVFESLDFSPSNDKILDHGNTKNLNKRRKSYYSSRSNNRFSGYQRIENHVSPADMRNKYFEEDTYTNIDRPSSISINPRE